MDLNLTQAVMGILSRTESSGTHRDACAPGQILGPGWFIRKYCSSHTTAASSHPACSL